MLYDLRLQQTKPQHIQLSQNQVQQETLAGESIDKEYIDSYSISDDRDIIDLDATDGILYNDGDTMMEIKYPEQDIRVRIKER